MDLKGRDQDECNGERNLQGLWRHWSMFRFVVLVLTRSVQFLWWEWRNDISVFYLL